MRSRPGPSLCAGWTAFNLNPTQHAVSLRRHGRPRRARRRRRARRADHGGRARPRPRARRLTTASGSIRQSLHRERSHPMSMSTLSGGRPDLRQTGPPACAGSYTGRALGVGLGRSDIGRNGKAGGSCRSSRHRRTHGVVQQRSCNRPPATGPLVRWRLPGVEIRLRLCQGWDEPWASRVQPGGSSVGSGSGRCSHAARWGPSTSPRTRTGSGSR